jgi:phosphopantothenate-cysteine ligase
MRIVKMGNGECSMISTPSTGNSAAKWCGYDTAHEQLELCVIFHFMNPDDYFSTTSAPAGLQEISQQVQEFIDFNTSKGRPIALVTSGGTTVPLEAQTVRFLDNFSAGTRGATSAEYFIEQGYACIFLHRQWSLEPYTRHYTHSTNCFLDLLQEENGSVIVSKAHTSELQKVLHLYQRVSLAK